MYRLDKKILIKRNAKARQLAIELMLLAVKFGCNETTSRFLADQNTQIMP